MSGHGGPRTAGPDKTIGRPRNPDKPTGKTIRLSREQWAWLLSVAKARRISLNAFVAAIVSDRMPG